MIFGGFNLYRTLVRLLAIALAVGMSALMLGSPASSATFTGEISGTVSGPNASPLAEGANIFVRLWDRTGNDVDEISVAADGAYHATGLAPGNYRLEVTDSSAIYGTEFYSNKSSLADATPVAVANGSTTANINVQLAVGGSISGHVSGPGGTAIDPDSDVSVSVFDSEGHYVRWGHADSAGNYTVGGLSTGSYRVRFNDYVRYVDEFYSNKSSLAQATPVSVTSGATTPNINAQLALAGSVSGHVTASGGMPLHPSSSVYVSVIPMGAEDDEPREADVAADGTYVVHGLNPGSYRVKFIDRHGVYASSYFAGSNTASGATPVVVSLGESTLNIDGSLSSAGMISGSVTGPDGAALKSDSDVTVRAYDSEGEFTSWSPIASDGTYQLRGLGSGQYRLMFEDDYEDYITEFYSDKNSLEAANSVTVNAGSTTSGINASLARAGRITGTVTGTAGSGLDSDGNIVISAYDTSGAIVASANLQTDGHFYLSLLPAGAYRLKVEDDSGAYLTQYFQNKATLADATPLTITAGETESDVDIELHKPAPPSAPLGATASPGNGTATVSWSAPASTGGSAITGYTVTATPGGATCTTTGSLSCQVPGLWNGTSYQFTVVATNAIGTSSPSLPSAGVTPSAPSPVVPSPSSQVPVGPTRTQPLLAAPKSMKRKKSKALPARTGAGQATVWVSTTPKVCKVKGNKVVAGSKKGTCKLRVTASGDGTWFALRQTFKTRVS